VQINAVTVYDPANSINGVKQNIYISGGKIVDKPCEGEKINGNGFIAMAGGIDIHSHIISAGKRAGIHDGLSAEKLAEEYLSQGVTSFIEPGLMPNEIDEAFTKNLPIDFFMLELQTSNNNPLHSKALGKKFVGEKGLELFMASTPDDNLPAPHIHLPNLAKPDGLKTLSSFLKKLDGRRCHLSHLQYYIFTKENKKLKPMTKEAVELLANHKNVTFDLGPVVFGNTFSLTADDELSNRIAKTVKRELQAEIKSPYKSVEYNFLKNCFIDSIFWFAGMEFLLETIDLSQASLSIDFPSGGSIAGYPQIIGFLMDKKKRDDFSAGLNSEALALSSLASIERDFSLYEIAMITRSSPAIATGLKDRGHLGVGAGADIALFDKNIFESKTSLIKPSIVIKDGACVS